MTRPALALALFLAAAGPALAECDRLPSCELVWSDEFDGDEVDRSRWELQIGDGSSEGLPAGWGNNELQYYREENATVAGGLLTITARRESVAGYEYTSARLRTRGMGDWTYGRLEMRARMPIGQGLWPAFWMLPTDSVYGSWAASGEIDIMENLGSEPDRVTGTLHYGGRWPENTFSGNEYRLGRGTFHDDFHVFAVEWERGEIRWYVDGAHYATQTEWFSTGGPYPAPFDVDFHLLLNLAVGGNLPGAPDETTSFPQQLVVDWVRVYQTVYDKGSQAATAAVSYDAPVRMRKIRGALATAFENQALGRDGPGDPRRVTCAVGAEGAKGSLKAKGRLELRLAGAAPSGPWASRVLSAALDRRSAASFDDEAIDRLVAEAAGAGATIRTLRVAWVGRGGKKVIRFTIDCLQRRDGSGEAPAASNSLAPAADLP